MHDEYKRALVQVIRFCSDEKTAIYCSSDGPLHATQYARIAAWDIVVKWAKEELDGSAKEGCSQ